MEWVPLAITLASGGLLTAIGGLLKTRYDIRQAIKDSDERRDKEGAQRRHEKDKIMVDLYAKVSQRVTDLELQLVAKDALVEKAFKMFNEERDAKHTQGNVYHKELMEWSLEKQRMEMEHKHALDRLKSDCEDSIRGLSEKLEKLTGKGHTRGDGTSEAEC